MPYCMRKRSECHLMNISFIWEALSRDATQLVSVHCLSNSLHGVNNQHWHVYLHERKIAKMSFIHFTVALRQGDAVNNHLLHRWHKWYSWFIVSSYWLPDISHLTLVDLALDAKPSKVEKCSTWPWLPAGKKSRYISGVAQTPGEYFCFNKSH